jgi:hypothetical protein
MMMQSMGIFSVRIAFYRESVCEHAHDVSTRVLFVAQHGKFLETSMNSRQTPFVIRAIPVFLSLFSLLRSAMLRGGRVTFLLPFLRSKL